MKKIFTLISLFVFIVTLSACDLFGKSVSDETTDPGDNNGSGEFVNEYSKLSIEEIKTQYNTLLNDYAPKCNADRDSYLKGIDDSVFAVNGEYYWWTVIYPVLQEEQCSIFSSDDYIYGISGSIENSDYLVTGVNFFSTYTVDENTGFKTQIQENILNTLLGVEDYMQENSITIYTNDSWNSRFMMNKYFNAVHGSGNWSHITITNDINSDYDLAMLFDAEEDLVNDAVSKNAPIYASYNNYWGISSGSQSMFNINVEPSYKSWQDINITSIKDIGIYNGMMEIYNLMETFDTNGMVLNIPSVLFQFENSYCGGYYAITDSRTDMCDFTLVTYSNDSSKNLENAFYSPVDMLASSIAFYDKQGLNIFELEGAESIKLALVYADKLRETNEYNFDDYGDIVNHTEFYKTIFADQVISYARPDNSLQYDLGEYSPYEDEIQLLSVNNTSLSIDLYNKDDLTATGIYIKAGQSATITRTDSNPNDITIYINYQRTYSTRIYGSNDSSYNRPYVDRSNAIVIEAGGSVTISTPKGGQLFVAVPDNTSGDSINLNIDNILFSPFLDSTDSSSIASFVNDVINSPFNWVDIKTGDMQLHSRRDYMLETFEEYSNDLNVLLYDIDTYLMGNNYYNAGIMSNNSERSQSIIDFFASRNLIEEANSDIHRRRTQHFYADEAQCGYMCSAGGTWAGPSNYSPIDGAKYFSPVFWGENHELGHGLQMNLLSVYGGASTEVSNNVYAAEVVRQYALANGETYYDARYSLEEVFDMLQADIANGAEPSSSSTLWTNGGYFHRLAFYEQLIYATNDSDFYAKINILTRIIYGYVNNESSFDLIKVGLGLSEYSYSEFQSMSSTDWIAIASSLISDRNLSEFCEGFGLSVSDKAKEQINANGYSDSLGKVMYYVPSDSNNDNYLLASFEDLENKDIYIISLTDGTWTNPVL